MAFHLADFQVEAISCDQGTTHTLFQHLMVITLPDQYGLACIFIILQKVWLERQKGGLSGTHMPSSDPTSSIRKRKEREGGETNMEPTEASL